MIAVRRARVADAAAIGAVHVAAWRSAYAGILPNDYLAGLSARRQAAYYESAIRGGLGVHVGTASGTDAIPPGGPARVIGFVTGGHARQGGATLGEGEIETLYVLDDWRDRGLGRRLVRAAAAHLVSLGCRSAFVWVLRDNPSRWFYERLGGRVAAEAPIQVAGIPLMQTAYVWPSIEKLEQSASSAS
ncbi:GNAT family N-acetyltransferase [Rhodovastum atsumiense]|uniref:GNAT family N-acetyltransferase n=1 Tax=Rhodovastum atsumiense TaxID=504468 RepID=A0A5M6J1Y7_9PROT|nr:GNAT family N-acetyltransferase [Rhodovastum atsumiense]KAA5614626.1 GNAT family N-acetyltransferase [Rhodovastum atsumiense]CAH2599864.1 GNAT family N-acetyltransferase [Rhodovastum atsumiense]